jgi:hypothetical protein
MITTKKKILLFDDTGRNDDYIVTKVLFQNREIIVCNVKGIYSALCRKSFSVMIYKKDGEVVSKKIRFYYAKNSLIA